MNNNYHCDISINTNHSYGVTYICQLDNNKKINDYAVTCLIQINKNQIISCSEDDSINVWEY